MVELNVYDAHMATQLKMVKAGVLKTAGTARPVNTCRNLPITAHLVLTGRTDWKVGDSHVKTVLMERTFPLGRELKSLIAWTALQVNVDILDTRKVVYPVNLGLTGLWEEDLSAPDALKAQLCTEVEEQTSLTAHPVLLGNILILITTVANLCVGIAQWVIILQEGAQSAALAPGAPPFLPEKELKKVTAKDALLDTISLVVTIESNVNPVIKSLIA
jgi:hypothetical protein